MNKLYKEQLTATAREYSQQGLSVIPVRNDKRPAIASWKELQKRTATEAEINKMFGGNAEGIAIIAGVNNIEILDIDCKNDRAIAKKYGAELKRVAPELLNKLVIQQTQSKGYHIIYKCNDIEGNQRLASNAQGEVVIETRGKGGYALVYPTNGYTLLRGDINNIPEITSEERATLFSVAKSFDETKPVIASNLTATDEEKQKGSPFEAYNKYGDILNLLQKHNWKIISEDNSKVQVQRPGKTDNNASGNFDYDYNRLHIFSTSSDFEANKSYSRVDVFIKLECNGDKKLAYQKLYESGYGQRKPEIQHAEAKIISDVDLLKINSTCRFLFSPFLPAVGCAVLAGVPDSGKSQLSRQFCIAIAAGQINFLGFEMNLSNKKALYIATEDDAVNTKYLFEKQMQGMDLKAEGNLNFIFSDALNTQELIIEIEKHLSLNPVDLIVIDSFGDVFTGTDQNNSAAMRQTVKAFNYLARKFECCILLVHHINKSGYKQAPHQMFVSGGAGLAQKCRTVLQLTNGENDFKYLTCVKGNYTPRQFKQQSLVLSFSEETFLFTNTSSVVATDAINFAEDKKDTKVSRLEKLVDDIFQRQSIGHKTFCERYQNITGKGIASANRDLKKMRELELVEKDGKNWQQKGIIVSTLSAA